MTRTEESGEEILIVCLRKCEDRHLMDARCGRAEDDRNGRMRWKGYTGCLIGQED